MSQQADENELEACEAFLYIIATIGLLGPFCLALIWIRSAFTNKDAFDAGFVRFWRCIAGLVLGIFAYAIIDLAITLMLRR